jgi:hypothetical protein
MLNIERRRLLLLGAHAAMVGVAPPLLGANRLAIRALLSSDTGPARQVVEELSARLHGLQSGTSLAELVTRPGRGIYLAIGPDALRAMLRAQLGAPIVSLFTSAATYARITEDPALRYAVRQVTAIYAETSPASQLEVIAQIYQRRTSVGILLAASTPHDSRALERTAKQLDIDLRVRQLKPNEYLAAAAAELRTDSLLLLADPSLYINDAVRALLESTYRRAQPVFGYSPALVTSGTVATTYATTDDITGQLADVIDQANDGRWPDPQYPARWHVTVNRNVARSLDLALPDRLLVGGTQYKSEIR